MNQSILYFASSLSLAILELRANGTTFEEIREECHFGRLALEADAQLEKVPEHFYSKDWILVKHGSQDFGSQWYRERRSLFLEVKSAVLPLESNYLVNADHRLFEKLVFSGPMHIPLDPRL